MDHLGDVVESNVDFEEPVPDTLPHGMKKYFKGISKRNDTILIIIDLEKLSNELNIEKQQWESVKWEKPKKIDNFQKELGKNQGDAISKTKQLEMEGTFNALNCVQAVIEFKTDGTNLKANDNFCKALGYSLEEIVNQHHKMFCELEFNQSFEYSQLWQRLSRSEFEFGNFIRLKKNGDVIWINASYNPVFDDAGYVMKVVKFATDITK